MWLSKLFSKNKALPPNVVSLDEFKKSREKYRQLDARQTAACYVADAVCLIVENEDDFSKRERDDAALLMAKLWKQK